MRILYRLTLCLAALLLPTTAAAGAPNESCLGLRTGGPAGEASSTGVLPETLEAELIHPRTSTVAFAPPEVTSRNTKQRPEAFWWRSPEEVLESLYGVCGVRDCCKYCVKGKACGNTCIERADTCHVGCGCACQKPLFFGES